MNAEAAVTVRDLVQAHLATLRERNAQSERAKTLLAAAPMRSWPTRIAAEPTLQSEGGVRYVLERARAELYRDARIGLRIVNAVLALPLTDVVLRGRALRLRATALLFQDKLKQAHTAIALAQEVLATDSAGAIELLHARLFAAYLKSQSGNTDVMLEMRVIAKAFAAHGDARGALQARMMEANVLFERGDFLRALRVNQDAARIGETLKDEQQQALSLANAGQCAERLANIAHDAGDTLRARTYADEALSYLASAKTRYAKLHMDAESQRVVWAMAAIAKQRGNLAEARDQLLGVRAEFLERGMYRTAAFVGLELLELLIITKRTDLAASWYEEIEHAFAQSAMPPYVQAAFARVRTAVAERSIDTSLLATVRAEIERFEEAA
ncbi:MAG TPA: hypothetical protein VGQ36_03715 [Thermoanaerobaculia bacterium]|jgi:hypothetical protein|nr:hypothetical protein [Thermoanaerobaculia bacterium]